MIGFDFAALAAGRLDLHGALRFGHDGRHFKAAVLFKKYVHAGLSIRGLLPIWLDCHHFTLE